MLAIIDTVRPKLIKDDMFIGDEKALEINLFTPGGLQTPNFSDSAMAALEEKVVARGAFGNRLENSRLATL